MRNASVVVVVVMALLVGTACTTWAELVLPKNTNLQLKFQNWDVGTLYSGTVAGWNLSLGGLPQTAPQASNPGEDGWGIFSLDNIRNEDLNTTIWSSSGSGGTGGKITGIFWGLDDVKLYQKVDEQSIFSNGLKFAFYYDPAAPATGAGAFDFTGGGAGPWARQTSTNGSSTVYIPGYPTAADPVYSTPLWTGVAVPGYAKDPLTGAVDATVSFESIYNTANNTSDGGFLADLGPVTYVDAFGVTQTLVGSQNGDFAEQNWGTALNPFYADLKFHYTADTIGVGKGSAAWLLHSNDPGKGTTVPEPSSLALLPMALFGVAMWRRRGSNA